MIKLNSAVALFAALALPWMATFADDPKSPPAPPAPPAAVPASKLVTEGRQWLAEGQFEKALASFQAAAALDPAEEPAWDGQIDALGKLNRGEEVWPVMERWVQAQPGKPEPLIYQALFAGAAGRFEVALQAFEQLLKLEPAESGWWIGRGQMLAQLGRSDEALESFGKAAVPEAKPADRAKAWNLRGMVLLSKANYEEAAKSFDQARELEPENECPWYNGAIAHAFRKETENALAGLKRAIELRPDLKARALDEQAFQFLKGNPEFQGLVGSP